MISAIPQLINLAQSQPQSDQARPNFTIDEFAHYSGLRLIVYEDLRMGCRRPEASISSIRPATPEPGFIDQVLSLLTQNISINNAQDAVASALHITPRALNNYLAEHGLQFKTLHDELRYHTALDLLRTQQHRNICEIAVALGYSNSMNFIRAFKRWTGLSPSQFQLEKVLAS